MSRGRDSCRSPGCRTLLATRHRRLRAADSAASPRQRHKRPEVVKSCVIKCCFIVRLIHDGAAWNQNEMKAGRGVRGPATNYRLFFLALLAHRVREATCGVKESPVTRWGPRVRVTKSEAEGQRSPLVYLEGELSLGPPSASAGAALSKSSAFFLFPALNGS